jgi:hypothetical protein
MWLWSILQRNSEAVFRNRERVQGDENGKGKVLSTKMFSTEAKA